MAKQQAPPLSGEKVEEVVHALHGAALATGCYPCSECVRCRGFVPPTSPQEAR